MKAKEDGERNDISCKKDSMNLPIKQERIYDDDVMEKDHIEPESNAKRNMNDGEENSGDKRDLEK